MKKETVIPLIITFSVPLSLLLQDTSFGGSAQIDKNLTGAFQMKK